ncbi:MAG: hypothetical protein EAZ97_12070 [Bacteroidetes bacterium]|nr:MAG: hypothetical protein EAZ97_12070 [Bacteroidota bacterium]
MITGIRLYITYVKLKRKTGEKYVGMASALVADDSEESADKVLMRRENAPHHKNKDGFEAGKVDKISTDRNAIRGREQMLYEHFEKESTITS